MAAERNLLRVVYDSGPVSPSPWDDFSAVRERSQREWAAMQPHKNADPLSQQLMAKIAKIRRDQ